MAVTLKRLPETYGIAQLDPGAAIPAWCEGEGFVSVSRADDELSIVCPEARIPPDVRADRGWCGYTLVGTFALDEAGILVSVLAPLSGNGLGIFAVSTFNGDFVLVKQTDRDTAERHLRDAGHTLI